MKIPRAAIASVLVLAFAVFGAGSAGAKAPAKKGPIVPKVGAYKGTATASGQSNTVTAQVSKASGKTAVLIVLQAPYNCADGTSEPNSFSIIADVKNGAFNYSATGSDGSAYKLSGKFTSTTAFTGTASKAGVRSRYEANSPQCSTGTVKFSLKK